MLQSGNVAPERPSKRKKSNKDPEAKGLYRRGVILF